MQLKRWATRQLATGDLTALQDLRNGKPIDNRARIERLRIRGFVKGRRADELRITLLGRIALLAKRAKGN